MRNTARPKPQAAPRPGEDKATDGAVLAQLAALQRMSVNELKAKWESLFSAAAPNNSRSYLESRIASRIQELTYGGLSRETRRALDVLADEIEGKIDRKRMADDGRNPSPGTKLIREWDGAEHTVTVLGDGYAWEGRKYRSLSAVAKAITGTNWNGFRFFGLRDRQRSGA
jgi:Protein of unknown function (DUF2924)